jgi:hypothetical protein
MSLHQGWSWGSSDSIVSDYKPSDRGSIPATDKRIFPLASVYRPALGPPSLVSNVYRVSFPGGKARQGRDADHSPNSSAKVKKELELEILSPTQPAWCSGKVFFFTSKILMDLTLDRPITHWPKQEHASFVSTQKSLGKSSLGRRG